MNEDNKDFSSTENSKSSGLAEVLKENIPSLVVGAVLITFLVTGAAMSMYSDYVKGQTCSKLEKGSEVAVCLNGVGVK